jgi:hypothetical protein
VGLKAYILKDTYTCATERNAIYKAEPVILGSQVNKPCKYLGAINTPILTTATKYSNLYIIDVPTKEILLTIEENSNTWHQRIGYISNQVLNKLLQAWEGVAQVTLSSNIYNSCVKAKFTNKVNKGPTNKPKYYLEKVVADLNGPITPNIPQGGRYIILFLDVATRFLEYKILKSKVETYEAFIEFKAQADNNSLKRKIGIFN